MSTEQVILTWIRIRDKFGNPACACDFETGEVCDFYRTQRLGLAETCLFAPGESYTTTLKRRVCSVTGEAGMGTLIPGNWCPLWKGQIEETQEEEEVYP